MINWQNVDLDAPYVSPTARPFQVGDRVRVRLSPECPNYGRAGTPSTRYENRPALEDTHSLECNGAEGVVYDIASECGVHNVIVQYTPPVAVADPENRKIAKEWWGASFAASELELLDGAS